MSEYELAGGAFILQEGGNLIRVRRESFPTEAQFQELIASYPELLAGEMISPEQPRRWLLVDREAGIADSEGGSDRWAVDHVFVDQEGTPTFVEVKRRSDARLKRDVVAQIIGYVAFATAYLSGERLRELYEDRVRSGGGDPDAEVRQFLRDSREPDDFWEEVALRMQSGEVRALVVADEIPSELQRLLEFLNERMTGIEVLGLELQLYATQDFRTLVPRIVGRTAHSEDRKRRNATRNWSVDDVRSHVVSICPSDAVEAFDKLLEWANGSERVIVETGTGAKVPSIRMRLRNGGSPITFSTLSGFEGKGLSVMLYFGTILGADENLLSEDQRRKFLQEVAAEIDPNVAVENTTRYPSFYLKMDPSATRTIDLLGRMVSEMVKAAAGGKAPS